MNIDQKYIADLIVKFLKKDAMSNEEKTHLEIWMSSNPSYRSFVNDFKDYSNISDDLNVLSVFEEHKAWEDVLQKRKNASYRKLNFAYLLKTACIILFVAFLSFAASKLLSPSPTTIYQNDKKIVEDVNGKYENDVLPAESSARLILADGSSISVDKSHVLVKDGMIQLEGSDAAIYTQDLQEKVPVFHTLSVPRASFFQMTLSDGTKVWLNSMSQLHFPSEFVGSERRVKVEGEAYFEVTKDINRPFFVDVGTATVKVLGTHFSVNSYRRKTKTTLVEGSVEVITSSNRKILNPGEQAESDHVNISVKKIDVFKAIAWKNGEFKFKQDNIAHIADQLSLWYDLDVQFKGNISLYKQYTGSISRNSKLTEVLDMLQYVSKLNFDLKGKSLTIEEKQTKK